MLYNFMYLTCNLLYIMLICIKLHIEYMLFHIGIKVEPFRCDDDEDFRHNIIGEADAAEFDGSEYLNDTGHGDTEQQEELAVKDISVEVYRICAYIYKYFHEFCMYIQCVLNRYFSRHPDRVGNQNRNEGRKNYGGAY